MNVEVSRIDIGLALLISNDYVGSTSQELKFTHKDSDGLKQVFENDFLYKVYQNKNTSKKEFLSCCKCVAEYKYPKTCKRIVVYFSGHGKDGSVLQLQDGEYVSIDDMISLFKPDIANNNSLVGIVKLFFIDACRGRGEEAGCLISKGAVAVKYPTVSSEANIFVAYASPRSYMSYGGSKGSRWTKCLIEAFKKSKVEDNVYDILTATHVMMSEKSGRHQTPEFTSRLTDVVYFKKEAVDRQKEKKKQDTTRDLKEGSTGSRGAEGFSKNDYLTDDALTNLLREKDNPFVSDTENLSRKRKNPLQVVGTSSDLDWLSGGSNSASKRDSSSGLDWLSGGNSSISQRKDAVHDFMQLAAESRASKRDIDDDDDIYWY